MRTITAAQQAVLDSRVQADFIRVSVKDSGGTFRDLTTYPGFNAVKTVQLKEQVSDPHATLELSLHRELYQLTLAPMMQDSAINRAFNPAASYSPLLALNREVKVELAVVPMDTQPQSGDWMEVFRGRIDAIDTARGYDIGIQARSLGGRLAQQFIKTERVYSFAEVAGTAVSLRIWAPDTDYVAGEYLIPATRAPTDTGYDKFFVCATSGTSDAEEPSWSTGTGIVDGTAEWDYVGSPSLSGNPVQEIIQNILDDNRLSGDPAVTLYVPSSPGWNINEFLQQREYTLDAIRNLAQQIGWDVRYKWRSGTSQFELTLFEPQRSTSTVLYTFGPSDYLDLDKLSISISEIRNAWRVIYPDAADLWPDGTPKRKVIDVSDSASITKYGELWAEIQEDEASQIDSATEATKLADAALSDCAEPTAEMSVTLRQGFPWVEINDYYSFTANGKQFSTTQSLAVTSWTQTFENGKLKTKLELRGKPTIGASTHIKKSTHPRLPPKRRPHRLQDFEARETASPELTSVVGGLKAKTILTPTKNALIEEFEHHVYPGSGTPLTSSTLVAVTKSREFTITDLIPGKNYYHRMVSRTKNDERLVRSQPTAEQLIPAGQAATGHLEGSPAWGRQPLNGGFETKTDPSGMPDHWRHVSGDAPTVLEGAANSPVSGSRVLRISCDGTPTEIRSAVFQVQPGTYSVTWWVKHDGGTGVLKHYINSYDADEVNVDSIVLDELSAGSTIDDYDVWVKRGQVLTVPIGSTYLECQILVDTTGDAVIYIDEISVKELLPAPGGQVVDNSARTVTNSAMETMFTTSGAQTIPGGFLRVVVETSMFSDDVDTVVALDVVLTWDDNSTETVSEKQYVINQANVHVPMSMTFIHPTTDSEDTSTNHQAGVVGVELRWRRVSGAGTITQDTSDFTFITITET